MVPYGVRGVRWVGGAGWKEEGAIGDVGAREGWWYI